MNILPSQSFKKIFQKTYKILENIIVTGVKFYTLKKNSRFDSKEKSCIVDSSLVDISKQ